MNVILKKEINDLARLFYGMLGCKVESGYDFSKAKHPTEKLMWQKAEISYEFWSIRKRV